MLFFFCIFFPIDLKKYVVEMFNKKKSYNRILYIPQVVQFFFYIRKRTILVLIRKGYTYNIQYTIQIILYNLEILYYVQYN